MNDTFDKLYKIETIIDRKITKHKKLITRDNTKFIETSVLNGFKTEHEKLADMLGSEGNRFERLYIRQYGRNGNSINSKIKMFKRSLEREEKIKAKIKPKEKSTLETTDYGESTLLAIPKRFRENYDYEWIAKSKRLRLLRPNEVDRGNSLSIPRVPNQLQKKNLKDYDTFQKTLNYIEYDNLILKDKLNKARTDYQNCSMKIDTRLVVNKYDFV